MKIDDVQNKTCLIGLSYFDIDGEIIQQVQHSGKVVNTDPENGISIEIIASTDDKNKNNIATDSARIFVLPASLVSWFVAPPGTYRGPNQELLIENPDYFVVWDIYRSKDRDAEGVHEWWDWRPQTTPPTAG